MGSLIKVENNGSKHFLRVNKEDSNQSLERSKWDAGYSAGGSFLGLVSANMAANLGKINMI